jgi:hypothetical protein
MNYITIPSYNQYLLDNKFYFKLKIENNQMMRDINKNLAKAYRNELEALARQIGIKNMLQMTKQQLGIAVESFVKFD